jgi:hypothetical protein
MVKLAGIGVLAVAAAGLAWGADGPATQPAVESLFAHRVPHLPPQPGEMRTLTVKELGNFDYDPEKGGPVPADVQALSGMKVRISGFMMPLEQSDVITEFALVPSLTSCCFGQPPGVQHIITVHCPKTRPAPFSIDPVVVEGTLKVSVQREDNYTVSIFEINDATAKPIQLNLSKDVLQGAANYVPKGDVRN